MLILGFMGSPRRNGICSRLLQSTLDGAASRGVEVKRYDLIDCRIKYCTGCGTCFMFNPDLAIGRCPLKDDMHGILEEYLRADGYVFASPVYDVFVTALMKTFLERKIMLTYRPKEAYATIPGPRRPAEFRKMACIIATANCGDEFKELMGDPCFEAYQAHLPIEQVMTIDQFYVGGVETMTPETQQECLALAHENGIKLVEAIRKEAG